MACSSENTISPCGIICLCSEPRCDYQLCARQHCRLCDLPFDIENRLKPDGFLKTFCSCFLGESQALVGPQYPIAFYWMPMFYTVPCKSSEDSGSSSISSLSSESSHSLSQICVEETVTQNYVTLPSGTKTISLVPESNIANEKGTPTMPLIPESNKANEKGTPTDFIASVPNTSNPDIISTSPESSHTDYLPVPPLNTTLEADTVPESNFNHAELRESLDTWDEENEIPKDPNQQAVGLEDILGHNPVPRQTNSSSQRVNSLYQSYWSLENLASKDFSLHTSVTPSIGANLRANDGANQRYN